MIIESKPLLILLLMAFTNLLKSLQYQRKSMPLKTDEDSKLLVDVEYNIDQCEIMINVITTELETKH